MRYILSQSLSLILFCIGLAGNGQFAFSKSGSLLSVRNNGFCCEHSGGFCAIPNDLYHTNQWGLSAGNFYNAWDIETGSNSVKIGIVDSGILNTHVELQNRVNTSLSADFTGTNTPFVDTYDHGTAVAGVAGAEGNNNGVGICGACCDIDLVSLKSVEPIRIWTHHKSFPQSIMPRAKAFRF
jgi:hypothetical protein